MESLVGWLDANLISILNGVARGLLLFTMAVGLSLIFGLADVLNLAHGAVFLLGAYMAFQFAGDGTGFVVAVLAAVVLGVLLGGGLTAALRPISGRGHLDQALLTLGIAFVLSDIASIVWGNDFRSVPPPAFLRGSTNIVGHAYPTYRLAVIVVGLAIAGAVYALFERTQLGAVVRAAVEDRAMVSALGINVGRVLVAVFAIGSALAAFGGVIGGPVLAVNPGLDWEVLILALIVVVIGGLGSIKGAFAGALLIGQVQSLGVALVPQLAAFLLFGAMAVVLLVRPEGLFGDVTA
ncbi:MAG: branched-chain amino acid ABC transporter permease [Euzebyaceae bacterium]|jgi:branched-subunit amino acid ABC-type transport system permease component|nr:branched-chain amino acid ABC transporter permease [Euzebyaceae bacterium]